MIFKIWSRLVQDPPQGAVDRGAQLIVEHPGESSIPVKNPRNQPLVAHLVWRRRRGSQWL
jgi:hypothetical protein